MIADHQDLLDRLLGPKGPEVTCDECFELLDAYVQVQVDGGNADAAVPGMRTHLAGCPACHEEHESLAALVGEAGDHA